MPPITVAFPNNGTATVRANEAGRVVNTWEWEPMPGHGSVETATFEERDGRTTLTVHIRFATAEDFAGWHGSGATAGMSESYDRLEEHLARLKHG